MVCIPLQIDEVCFIASHQNDELLLLLARVGLTRAIHLNSSNPSPFHGDAFDWWKLNCKNGLPTTTQFNVYRKLIGYS